jgi:hypothetical protein
MKTLTVSLTSIVGANDVGPTTDVFTRLFAHGFSGALTGGLAVAAYAETFGHGTPPGRLNDLDFVVATIDHIPESLSRTFLASHVHPSAPEGKLLLQLVDHERVIRIDVFRAYGLSLTRTRRLRLGGLSLAVMSLEDLLARTTAHVLSHLRAQRPIESKYVRTFVRLSRLGDGLVVDAAWRDHREGIDSAFEEASEEAHQLIHLHPELMTNESCSTTITPCARCASYGTFQPTSPERVRDILGYW